MFLFKTLPVQSECTGRQPESHTSKVVSDQPSASLPFKCSPGEGGRNDTVLAANKNTPTKFNRLNPRSLKARGKGIPDRFL